MSFLGGGELGGGIFEAVAGAQIHFAGGDFRATGLVDWRGPGDVALTGGALQLVNTTGALLMRGGYIFGPSVLQGTLHWQGGGLSSLGSLTVAAGGVVNLGGAGGGRDITGALTNRGVFRWLDGGLGLYYQALNPNMQGGIWNEPGGVIDIQCDQSLASFPGLVGPLHNAGLLRKSGTAGTTYLQATLDNNGAIEARMGILSFVADNSNSVSGSLAVSGAF